jgi:hypothetical protein
MAWKNYRNKSKYNAKKVEIDGIRFDSVKESRRFLELKAMQEAEIISDLRRQVKYVLIPAQREPETVGKRGGKIKGKLLERECSYVADFVYKDAQGNTVVEDVKGYRGGGAYEIFKIKRKLMLYVHGIKIIEI